MNIETESLLKQSLVIFVVLYILTFHFACVPAFAQNNIAQTKLSDYAYMAKMPESSSKLKSVRVSEDIFISATQEGLLDIAVFDRNFKRLPSGIGYHAESQSTHAPKYRVEATPLFYKGAIYFEFERPSEAKPSSLKIIADKTTSLIKGEIFAGDNGIESKQLLNSQILYSNLDTDENRKSFSPSDNWTRYWFLPKNSPRKIYVDVIYSNLVVTFIGNGNGPYTLAWGNYEEPMKVDGLTVWDIDLGEAYPPAEMVKMNIVEKSGGESRLGGLAEGITP